MCCCDDVKRIDQSSTANVYTFFRILLQYRHLPRIFAEFAVTIYINWILDATIDSLRVPCTTLAIDQSWIGDLWTNWTAAANMSWTACGWTAEIATIVSLTLKRILITFIITVLVCSNLLILVF